MTILLQALFYIFPFFRTSLSLSFLSISPPLSLPFSPTHTPSPHSLSTPTRNHPTTPHLSHCDHFLLIIIFLHLHVILFFSLFLQRRRGGNDRVSYLQLFGTMENVLPLESYRWNQSSSVMGPSISWRGGFCFSGSIGIVYLDRCLKGALESNCYLVVLLPISINTMHKYGHQI